MRTKNRPDFMGLVFGAQQFVREVEAGERPNEVPEKVQLLREIAEVGEAWLDAVDECARAFTGRSFSGAVRERPQVFEDRQRLELRLFDLAEQLVRVEEGVARVGSRSA